METLWGFSWWWCMVPFALMGLAMIACFLLMARRAGSCANAAGCCGGRERIELRNPDRGAP